MGGKTTKETIIDWKLGMSTAEQSVAVKTNEFLTFKWSGFHNVYEFKNEALYKSCDFSGAKLIAEKPFTRKLDDTTGTFYYGCKVGSHCKFGQKVTVKITGDAKTALRGAPGKTTLAPGKLKEKESGKEKESDKKKKESDKEKK